MLPPLTGTMDPRVRACRRVAALYDVHGNLPALEAVLDAVDAWGADAVVVGGDVVLGPMPHECLARLMSYGPAPVHFLRGNCDRLVAAAGEGRLDAESGAARLPSAVRANIAWVADALAPAERDTCARWPASVSLAIEGLGPVHFCHATPRSDDELLTADTPEAMAAPMVAGIAERVVVCGHTHMQFDRTLAGGVRVLNAGSVGMPYGAPGAHWLRLGPEDVVFEQTRYDLDAAAARVRTTRFPGAADFAATSILAPPSAEVMRAAFSAASRSDPVS